MDQCVQGDTAPFAQLNIFEFFGKFPKILVRISPLIRLPILGQFSFLTRRATELARSSNLGYCCFGRTLAMCRLCRWELFTPDEKAIVHVMNRTVRRCFLFGDDELTGRNNDYRED